MNNPTDPFGIVDGYADLQKGSPTHDETQLVGNIQTIIQQAQQARRAREQAWEFNLVNLKGEQVLARSPIDGTTIRVTFDNQGGELQSQDNVLLPTHRAFVGKMTRIVPSCIVLPRTEDREDQTAAEVMDSHLDYQWRHQKMKKKYKRAMESLSFAGTGIHELCWDRDKGRLIGYCQSCSYGYDTLKPGDQCPACAMQAELSMQGGMANPAMTGQSVPQPSILVKAMDGDIVVDVLDVREFFPQPGIPDLENMQWCYTKKPVAVAKLRKMFPEAADVFYEEQDIHTDRSVTFSREAVGVQIEQHQLKGHANLFTIHEAPTGEHERGRIIFYANGRVLRQQPNIYYELFGRFPFFIYRADRYEGEFWGGAPIDQAWHLQRERDALATSVRSHRELTLNPVVMAGTNSGMDMERLTTVPGQVIKIRPNPLGKPSFMPPAQLPQHVYGEFDRLATAMRDKFGVTPHEVGQSAPDQSGRYAAMLESQASEAVGPFLIENLDEWLELHRCILMLAQRCYAPDRRWAIRGYDYPKSYSWDQANIREGWDLILADEDSLSKNPAMRLQQVMMLLDKGVYTDDATGRPDKKKFLRQANLRMPGSGPDLDAQHRAYAAAIPDMIARGEYRGPLPWDDAVMCCEEIVNWLRGSGLHAPDPLVSQIYQVWTVYANALNPQDPRAMGLFPNPALAGGLQQQQQLNAPQQAQPTQPAGSGAGGFAAPPQVGQPQDVNQQVQSADKMAEGVARAGMKQEGSSVSA